MVIRKLDKPIWPSFLDGMSKVVTGKRAEIEVASLHLGAQVQAEWLPLFGIVYDAKNDLIAIYLDMSITSFTRRKRCMWTITRCGYQAWRSSTATARNTLSSGVTR